MNSTFFFFNGAFSEVRLKDYSHEVIRSSLWQTAISRKFHSFSNTSTLQKIVQDH